MTVATATVALNISFEGLKFVDGLIDNDEN